MALQVWLPLNGDLTNNGVGNPTLSADGATVDNSGKLGKCYSFNGSTSCINITYSEIPNILNGDFSICMWLYHNDNSDRSILFGSYSLTGGFFNLEKQTNNKIRFYWNGNPDYNPQYSTLTPQQWNHIVITRKGNLISVYINGLLTDQATYTLSTVPSTNVNYRLGRDARSDYTALKGKMNDFRLYSHALSPKEIEILARGLVVHYPMTGGGRGGDNIITDTSPNEVQYTYPSSGSADRFFKTSTIVPSASQYILSFWAKSTHAGDKVRAHWHGPNTTTKSETNQGETTVATDGRIDFTLSDKWEKYWCVWTQSSTTAVKHFIFPRMYNQAAGQACGTGTVSIKCVKLEEGNVPTPWMPNSADTSYTSMGYNDNIEYDVSGYNHHGTITGTVEHNSNTARYSTCTGFNSSTYESVSIVPGDMVSRFTFAWWARNSYEGMFWGFANGNRLNLYMASGVYYWNTGDGANNPFGISSSTYRDGNWHHYAVTGDGTTVKLYIDGEFKANAKTFKGITGTSLVLNGWDSSSSYDFNGYLSDFRLYATCLSADQVKRLYNTAVSLSNNGALLGYEFVET